MVGMCKALSSIEEMLEGFAWWIRLLVDNFDIQTCDVLRAPVFLDALCHELAFIELCATVLVVIHDIEVLAGPDVADMLASVLRPLVFAHAQDQHGISVLEILKIEHCYRWVPVRIIKQLGLKELFWLYLVGIVVLLLHHGIPDNILIFAQLFTYKKIRISLVQKKQSVKKS